ncbi:uncharacterized protein ACBT44_006552 [Syngnathus typhle]
MDIWIRSAMVEKESGASSSWSRRSPTFLTPPLLFNSRHFFALEREVLSRASRIVADLSPLLANYRTMATLQVVQPPGCKKNDIIISNQVLKKHPINKHSQKRHAVCTRVCTCERRRADPFISVRRNRGGLTQTSKVRGRVESAITLFY